MKTDLTKVINGPGTKAQLEAARGQLAPFLRDTLVGLNYAYYEPPGAQMLHNNPLFVRSHDFSGMTIMGYEQDVGGSRVAWRGTPAGGGAYLMGSLADLPYALASGEQDFIAPENVQALIWKELVPELLVNATLSRLVEREPDRTSCSHSLSKGRRRDFDCVGQQSEAARAGDEHSLRSHGSAAAGMG